MITAPLSESVSITCQECGYDLRGHPQTGPCPECGTSIAESHRRAAIPRRPLWAASDPRWRRRILAGLWVLLFIPLLTLLSMTGLARLIVIPTPFDYKGALVLEDTFANDQLTGFLFFSGSVLLFSLERFRQPSRFDWTRRWGIAASYLNALFQILQNALITFLVLTGVAAMFLTLPSRFQPHQTTRLLKVADWGVRHSPYPGRLLFVSLYTCSTITILLMCAPLYQALRATRIRRRYALIPLALLAISALRALYESLLVLLTNRGIGYRYVFFDPYPYRLYFSNSAVGISQGIWETIFDAVPWLTLSLITLWLTLAQIRTWFQPRTALPVQPPQLP